MKKNKLALSVLSMTLIGSMLAGCTSKDDSKPTDTKQVSSIDENAILRITAGSDIPSLDPGISTDAESARVLGNVMEGLYRLDKDNKPVPAVAEKVDISKDGLTYTFTLRDSKWSDGSAVTAKDFEYAWKRALDPKTASQYAFILYYLKGGEAFNTGKGKVEDVGVKATDDKTLVVTLAKPTSYFLSLAAFATYFPLKQEFVEKQGKNFALKAENFLYNGPFTMKDWQTEQGYKLVKNDNYYAKQDIKIAGVDVKIVKDTATDVNLYEAKSTDMVGLTAEFVDKYKSSKEFHTRETPVTFFLRLNQTKNPALKNVDIRKAIAQSWDRQAFTDTILNNGSKPAVGLVPSGLSNVDGKDFRDFSKEQLAYDKDAAQKSFEKGMAAIGKKEIALELLITDSDVNKKIGEYIQNQLQTNLKGVKVTIKVQPFKQSLALMEKLDYDMAVSGWNPDYMDPSTFTNMFRTNDPFNEMGYSNPKYDELLKQADAELDAAKRFELLAQAEDILMNQDAAIAPMQQRGTSYLVREGVKGLVFHPVGGDQDYRMVTIDKK